MADPAGPCHVASQTTDFQIDDDCAAVKDEFNAKRMGPQSGEAILFSIGSANSGTRIQLGQRISQR